jgi:hypothetical protein
MVNAVAQEAFSRYFFLKKMLLRGAIRRRGLALFFNVVRTLQFEATKAEKILLFLLSSTLSCV